jgi:hypothetical protein
MAELRCPNCGKNNPDVLDVCQFCQTPLKPESVLRIGQTPTKKNTGELESVLPDWLKDMRQQARDSAEADAAAQAHAQSRTQKNEPPDLLAGLASQASSADEEDVPDWLASINPTARSKPSAPSQPEPTTDFFAQFNQNASRSESVNEPPQTESSSGIDMGNQSSATEKDELSNWFAQASGQPEETVEFDQNAQQNDMGWAGNLGSLSTSAEPPAPKEEEDLSWLHNLEAAAKQTGDLQSPKKEMDWNASFEMPSTSSQSASKDDLSWLDNLGGVEEPSQQVPEQPSASQNDLSWLDRFGGISEPSQPSQAGASQEDLSWLNNLGGVSEHQPSDAAPNDPISPQPFASEEDLSWLNKLGGTSEPSQPSTVVEPAAGVESTPEKPSSEDLSWLKNFGVAPESSQAPAAQDDLSWLNTLGGESESLSSTPFNESASEKTSPRQTAPLGQGTEKDSEPDWLKSAIERPSMPAPGDVSMDWFASAEQPADEKPVSATPQPAPFESDFFSTPSEPSTLSNQEVDSLFSVEMPDWLSRSELGTEESVSQQADVSSAESDKSLSPVDLPSWVQAMRPVEAVISETTPSVADQPTETEGPLAGLQGVIPIAPIGSSRRPKAVSLKLQASDEQQAGAALLEQILGSETSPRTLITSSFVAPQQWLRWALTGLFLIVLSAVIFLRSQSMPVSASLPVVGIDNLSNAVVNIPANAKVLVIIDYEPSLAGEMEAISGTLLDQMTQHSHPNFSFLSTSPNGAALVERLINNTTINQSGSPYLNIGYLPGGATGVLGFIESPKQVDPLADVQSFSEYSALVILSDHAESGRVWVEQLQNQKQIDTALTNQPLLMVASAQAGPLLQPYLSSGQITGLISGISDAAKYETKNSLPAGITRSYWDTFGIGLIMSIALIIVGSLWSLFTGIRARRADAKQG